MRDYICLQMDYLLSKITVTVILILLTVIMLASVYNAQIMEGYGYIDGFRQDFLNDYLNETFIIIEFVLVFISVYIGIVLAGSKNQSLMMYSVYSMKTKNYHIFSRIVTGIIIITILLLIVGLANVFIIHCFTPYTYEVDTFIKTIGLLWLELLQYFMMTIILLGIINHFLFGLLPLLVFWVLEILAYDLQDNIRKFIDIVFINIHGYYNQEKSVLIFLIIFHFLTISYIIVMQKKDC